MVKREKHTKKEKDKRGWIKRGKNEDSKLDRQT